jgi:hypothetical protein
LHFLFLYSRVIQNICITTLKATDAAKRVFWKATSTHTNWVTNAAGNLMKKSLKNADPSVHQKPIDMGTSISETIL